MKQDKLNEKAQEKIFNRLLKKQENQICADCPTKGPCWVSLDFGIFICMNCSGAHRHLSPKVTRVRSTKLDSWIPDFIEILDNVGNQIANQYWENNISAVQKTLTTNSSLDERILFIQDKYLKKKLADPNGKNPVLIFLEKKAQGIIEPPQQQNQENKVFKSSNAAQDWQQWNSFSSVKGQQSKQTQNLNQPQQNMQQFNSYNGYDAKFKQQKVIQHDLLNWEEEDVSQKQQKPQQQQQQLQSPISNSSINQKNNTHGSQNSANSNNSLNVSPLFSQYHLNSKGQQSPNPQQYQQNQNYQQQYPISSQQQSFNNQHHQDMSHIHTVKNQNLNNNNNINYNLQHHPTQGNNFNWDCQQNNNQNNNFQGVNVQVNNDNNNYKIVVNDSQMKQQQQFDFNNFNFPVQQINNSPQQVNITNKISEIKNDLVSNLTDLNGLKQDEAQNKQKLQNQGNLTYSTKQDFDLLF